MKKEFYTDRIDLKYSANDRHQVSKDIKELMDLFSYILNVLLEKNVSVKRYQYFIEILINKYIFYVYSIINLMTGTQIKSKYFKSSLTEIDISSIFVLIRTIIENYLTYYYLFIQPNNEDEELFRFSIFEMSGLYSRQKFNSVNTESRRTKEAERRRIDELENIIYSNPLFLQMTSIERKRISNLKPAKIYSWRELLVNADLNEDLFKQSWQLYSNYAHSEYISQIQLYGYSFNKEESKSTMDIVFNTILSLTSVFIIDFTSKFNVAKERYALINSDSRKLIVFFNAIGRKELLES